MSRPAQLDHEKFMVAKGIAPNELPEELQQADKVLREAKKEDFEAANEASKLLVEALQESIYEINDTIEKIGETLSDHETRITELEKPQEAMKTELREQNEEIQDLQEQVAELQGIEPGDNSEEVQAVATTIEELYSSKEEEILAKLHQEQQYFITKAELKDLGFNVGFFSKLTIRGAKYGNYELKKAPSEKVFQVIKLA